MSQNYATTEFEFSLQTLNVVRFSKNFRMDTIGDAMPCHASTICDCLRQIDMRLTAPFHSWNQARAVSEPVLSRGTVAMQLVRAAKVFTPGMPWGSRLPLRTSTTVCTRSNPSPSHPFRALSPLCLLLLSYTYPGVRCIQTHRYNPPLRSIAYVVTLVVGERAPSSAGGPQRRPRPGTPRHRGTAA